MRFSLAGINHRTAPVTIREKAAISHHKLPEALTALRSYIPQGIVLSTCNRTEVYATCNDYQNVKNASMDFFRTRLGIADDILLKHVYLRDDSAAVEHLFRLTSGLESMIIGEYEVLGQVRNALEHAEKSKMVTLPLRHIFQDAIRTGRRVREETAISRNAISVSSVAVDLAAGVLGGLKNRKMIVIGTGEAGRLVAKVASDREISRIVVVGRTHKRSQELAEKIGAVATDSSRLGEELFSADIVVTCTGAPHKVIRSTQIQRAMAERPDVPLVIIDIAVPRNVESDVGLIDNVFLYNIDDLTRLSHTNRDLRENEIIRAEEIIGQEMDRFVQWWQEYKVRPLVRAMLSKADEIRCIQLNRTLKKLPALTEEERYRLDMMSKAIVTKILKDPISNLKGGTCTDHEDMEMVKKLFSIDTGGGQ